MRAPVQSCPRCDYDLSGEVATWDRAGACPLEGTCPECGGALHWKNVLRPEDGRLIGFVEDARGVRRRFTWALRTLWWALWPWKFWTKVGDRERVSPVGWVWWVLVVIWLPRMVAGVGGTAILTVFERLQAPRAGVPIRRGPGRDWASTILGNHINVPYLLSGDLGTGLFERWPHAYRFLMLEIIAWPLAVITISEAFGRGGARSAVVVRGAVFSLVPFAALGLLSLLHATIQLPLALVVSAKMPATWINECFRVISAYSRGVDDIVPWIGVAWVSLWWLAAISRGLKHGHAPQAWIVRLILINVILCFLFGPRIDPFAR